MKGVVLLRWVCAAWAMLWFAAPPAHAEPYLAVQYGLKCKHLSCESHRRGLAQYLR